MKRSKYIGLLFLPALIGCTNRCVMSDYHDIPDNSLIKLCVRDTYPYDIIPCDDLPRVSPSANEFQDQFGYTYHQMGSSAHREVVSRTKVQAKPKIETEMSSIHYEAKNYIKPPRNGPPAQDAEVLRPEMESKPEIKIEYYTEVGINSSTHSHSTNIPHTIYHINSMDDNPNNSRRRGFGSKASSSSSSSSSSRGSFSSGS